MKVISQDREDVIDIRNMNNFLFPAARDEEGEYSIGFDLNNGTTILVGFYKDEIRAIDIAAALLDSMNKKVDYFIMPKE